MPFGRRLFWLGVAVVVLLGAGLRLQAIGQAVGDAPQATLTTGALARLQELGALRLDPASLQIDLPAEDEVLWRKARGTADPEIAEAVQLLYETDAGQALRREVALWNAGHRLAAIRDNRAGMAGLAGDTNASGWLATDDSGHELATSDRVPETFGFINHSLIPGFGDWAMVAAAAGETVHFSTTLTVPREAPRETPRDREWLVQVIGLPAAGAELGLRVDDRMIPLARRCRRSAYTDTDCTGVADAYVSAAIPLSPGVHRATITVRPTTTQEARVPGLQLAQSGPGGRLAGPGGRLEWVARPSAASLARRVILSADGVPLTTDDSLGRPTATARALGLMPLLGLDNRHADGLAGQLAIRQGGTGDDKFIRVSLDTRVQRAAQEALTLGLDRLFEARDTLADDRRAVVVALDAETGTLLAAAQAPGVPEGVHRWDHLAYLHEHATDSPLTPLGWRGASRHGAPGSTFKLVTALTALRVRARRNDVREMLDGADRGRLARAFGLGPTAISYQPDDNPDHIIRNFGPNEGMAGRIPLESSFDPSASARVGLKEAVRDSVNIWFARLAILVDGAAAGDYDARWNATPYQERFRLPDPEPPLAFVDTLTALGLTAPVDLLAPLRPRRTGAAPHDHLVGEPIQSDLLAQRGGPDPTRRSVPYPMVWILAQNSIGQGVRVTPLRLAVLAAGIRSGRRIVPTLALDDRTKPDAASAPVLLDGITDRDLEPLRAGMKAVVLSDTSTATGTAERAFAHSPRRDLTYGKTGTANVGSNRGEADFVTTWFTGWSDPDPAPVPVRATVPATFPAAERAGGRPIAFACMVTHAHGGHRNTGGSVCAPIICTFLNRLDQADGTQTAGRAGADERCGLPGRAAGAGAGAPGARVPGARVLGARVPGSHGPDAGAPGISAPDPLHPGGQPPGVGAPGTRGARADAKGADAARAVPVPAPGPARNGTPLVAKPPPAGSPGPAPADAAIQRHGAHGAVQRPAAHRRPGVRRAERTPP